MDNHADRTHSLPFQCSHTQSPHGAHSDTGILDLAWSRCMIYEYSEHRPARAITCATL
jgi:hypothetical protein